MRSFGLVLLYFQCAIAFPMGYTSDCPSAPAHGSGWASGSSPYSLSLSNFAGTVTAFTPGQTYTLTLSGASFDGFVLAGFAQSGLPAFDSGVKAGSMTVTTGAVQLMFGCARGSAAVTHTSNNPKNSISVRWTAPTDAEYIGPVTFLALVVINFSSANWRVALTVPCAVSPSASSSVSASTSESASVSMIPPSPTGTQTPAPPSPSRSPSSSIPASSSQIRSGSGTATRTGSPTGTRSTSITPSQSGTSTNSQTSTSSGSQTRSLTASQTASGTASQTRSSTTSQTTSSSSTQTASGLPTATQSASPTRSPSQTASPGSSLSQSSTQATTPSISPSPTCTGTASESATPSESTSQSPAATPTGTQTFSQLPSSSQSGTPSTSKTRSQITTPSNSRSPSSTRTPSQTISQSSSGSISGSASMSGSMALSPSASTPPSYSKTGAPTPSRSQTRTRTVSRMLTPTSTPTSQCVAATTCSGSGFCDSVGLGTCICNVGYSAPTCATCAPGFSEIRGNNPSCIFNSSSGATAYVKIGLLIPNATAAAWGSIGLAEFTLTMKMGIASSLGVPAARIVVVSVDVSTNSTLIAILPTTTDASSSPDVAMLVTQLITLVGTPTSILYRGGNSATMLMNPGLTVISTFSLTGLSAVRSPPSEASYAFSAQLTSSLSMQWRVDTSNVYFRVLCTSGLPGLWFSIGASSQESMVGGDVTVIIPGAQSTTSQVGQFTLSSRDPSGVIRVDKSISVASGENVYSAGGTWVAEFTRPYAKGNYSGSVPIATGAAATTVIFAIGSYANSYSGLPGSHAMPDAGVVSVVFSTGAYSFVYVPPPTTYVVHGTLMAISWSLIIPLGIFIAHFAKPQPAMADPSKIEARRAGSRDRSSSASVVTPAFWFQWHWRLQLTGSIISLAGAVLGVIMIPLSSQVRTSHDFIGVAITVGVLLQVLWAWFGRPAKSAAGSPASLLRSIWERCHLGLGYALPIVSVANVYLGMQLLAASMAWIIAYSVFIAIVVFLACLAQWHLCRGRNSARLGQKSLQASVSPRKSTVAFVFDGDSPAQPVRGRSVDRTASLKVLQTTESPIAIRRQASANDGTSPGARPVSQSTAAAYQARRVAAVIAAQQRRQQQAADQPEQGKESSHLRGALFTSSPKALSWRRSASARSTKNNGAGGVQA